MTQTTVWTLELLAEKGEQLYENEIKHIVESPENMGKFLTIDVETGDYRIDDRDASGASELRKARLNAQLFMLRIGFDYGMSL
jgi:hypothetical protein